MMSALPHFLALKTKSGERLAYRRSPGNQPGYVFLNGFQSTMNSKKALAVEEHCRSIGRSCVCFDYRGHGESDGRFNDYCLSDWIDDASTILEELKCGPQILVGSSMGAWISLLLAMKRPSGVSGIICIAAGVDFTMDLERGMEKEQKLELETDGFFFRHSEYSDRPYAITKTLLDDSRQYYLMNDGCSAIPIDHPVILLHGQRDGDIPWERSLQLAEKINSANIVVTLIKDGNHRLSRPIDLVQIVKAVDTMTALASCHV
jgi:pimeloyl-ACP methyl ester carboxylesterase